MRKRKGPANAIDVSRVMTEPMAITHIAEFFDVERREMSRMLREDEIPGAVKVGGFWRVPIQQMPCDFLLARGFVRAVTVPVETRQFRW
jgi:hypothetical protein